MVWFKKGAGLRVLVIGIDDLYQPNAVSQGWNKALNTGLAIYL